MADLKVLTQVGDLLDYIEAFDACAHRIYLLEGNLLSCFFTGLRDEIRYPVLMQGPKTLQQSYELSRMQDDYLTSLKTRKFMGNNENFDSPQ